MASNDFALTTSNKFSTGLLPKGPFRPPKSFNAEEDGDLAIGDASTSLDLVAEFCAFPTALLSYCPSSLIPLLADSSGCVSPMPKSSGLFVEEEGVTSAATGLEHAQPMSFILLNNRPRDGRGAQPRTSSVDERPPPPPRPMSPILILPGSSSSVPL